MDWWFGLLPVAGVGFGWMLNQLSDRAKFRREWHRRLSELRIESYSEWATGMDAKLIAYAKGSSNGQAQSKVPLCETRLLLIERDPEARRLIHEVGESFPTWDSGDHMELTCMARDDPDWDRDWPPYRQKMTELFERVRQTLR